MKWGRQGHGAIFDGEKILIVGGEPHHASRKEIKNEVFAVGGATVTCVEQSTTLAKQNGFPELFLVPEDFGKDLNKC